MCSISDVTTGGTVAALPQFAGTVRQFGTSGLLGCAACDQSLYLLGGASHML